MYFRSLISLTFTLSRSKFYVLYAAQPLTCASARSGIRSRFAICIYVSPTIIVYRAITVYIESEISCAFFVEVC